MSTFEAKKWLPDQLLSAGMSSTDSLSKPGSIKQLSLQEDMLIHILSINMHDSWVILLSYIL